VSGSRILAFAHTSLLAFFRVFCKTLTSVDRVDLSSPTSGNEDRALDG
jgi:hypothetical protein